MMATTLRHLDQLLHTVERGRALNVDNEGRLPVRLYGPDGQPLFTEQNPAHVKGEVTLTGQIVDPDENAVRTTTVGLSWVSWDPFGVTVLVPAGTFVDSPYQMVNGFGYLGVLCRDIQGGGVARHRFRVLVYWAASDTPGAGFSVPEVLIFDPSEDDTGVTGLARAVPTKSQYVRFRLFNDSETDRTYHFHAMLRAS